jgi:hypothetical protein
MLLHKSPNIWVKTSSLGIEPGGHALTTWLADKFEKRGQQVQELVGGHWGWGLVLSREPYRLSVDCRKRADSAGEWSAQACAKLGLVQKLFRTVDPKPEVDRVYRLLDEIMREARDR